LFCSCFIIACGFFLICSIAWRCLACPALPIIPDLPILLTMPSNCLCVCSSIFTSFGCVPDPAAMRLTRLSTAGSSFLCMSTLPSSSASFIESIMYMNLRKRFVDSSSSPFWGMR